MDLIAETAKSVIQLGLLVKPNPIILALSNHATRDSNYQLANDIILYPGKFKFNFNVKRNMRDINFSEYKM